MEQKVTKAPYEKIVYKVLKRDPKVLKDLQKTINSNANHIKYIATREGVELGENRTWTIW